MGQPASVARAARKNEIIIAVIGVLGVLATAVFSNWDKIFPPSNVVQSPFEGYVPTGDIEVELRYLMEITGGRRLMADYRAAVLESGRKEAEALHKDDPELLAEINKVLEDEGANLYDEALRIYIPVASKYFWLAEIQELNKFYSTPVMRDLMRKQPLIIAEYAPLALAKAEEMQARVMQRIDAIEGIKED